MKQYPPSYFAFIKSLPSDLPTLYGLLMTYEFYLSKLSFLLRDTKSIVVTHTNYVEDCLSMVAGWRLMLIEYIEDLELEKHQTIYN